MEFNGAGAFEYGGEIGQYQELKMSSVYQGEQFGISAVAFDLQEDLLWAATYGGHVTSFYGSSLEKYTAFQAHHSDIRQLQSTVGGIVSVSAKELRMTSRTGQPLFTLQDENALVDMNCALYMDESSLLVGCQGNKITTVDLSQGKIFGELSTNEGICLLKSSDYCVCSGDVTGTVHMLDPHTLHTVNSYPAHSAGMCDMDVVGHYLVTCGLVQQYGQLLIDCQLKVFDLRANRPLPPCDVIMLQPFLIKAVPALSSTILVLSQMGDFQLLDLRGLVTPSTMMVNQLSVASETVMACAMDVGPSCQCVAFGDSCGIVHLWADQEDIVFNPYSSQQTVLPTVSNEELPYISWDDNDPDSAPLSAIPMALSAQNGQLLSDWPPKYSRFKRRPTPPIDSEILKNMRMQQFIGRAPKPSHILRNQVPYDLEKDRWESVPESPMMRENNPLTLVPKPYRQVEIKYSKLGIEKFDFMHYNRTKFAGLEIHIPNAYCNSMIQVLYFLEPVRCAMQSHLCAKEFCLSCELGFLFRMLDRSDGQSCQASNFLRAFRTLREASGLGLLLSWEDEQMSRKIDLSKLIQSWTRFVLQQVSQETHPSQQQCSGTFSAIATSLTSPTHPTSQPSFAFKEELMPVNGEKLSIIERLFGVELETKIECGCGWTSAMKRTELLHSLLYPHKAKSAHSTISGSADGSSSVSFGRILQQSICRKQRLPAWCEQCGKYKSTTQVKQLCDLPCVLALTCRVETDQDREFWQKQQASLTGAARQRRWIPLEMELNLSNGELTVREGPLEGGAGTPFTPPATPPATPPDTEPRSAVYELLMAVSHVKEPWMESSGNLVAHINVGSSYHLRKMGRDKRQWYLFNDFHITPLKESEVGVFPTEWLTPCVLIYAQRCYSDQFNTEVSCQLEPSVLLAETHQPRTVQSPATFTPLSLAEIPERGDPVGIDAEFVTLNQEEAEVKSDGTHTTLKPSQLSVARITVTRGKGPAEGSPFIDDYIATSEQVVDYLTKFSGIKPGDLDALMSSKHLTTLKACYLKLLFLIDRGVVFVGHGLKKDFRVINIMVPPEQVIDTVHLFHQPNQRYISLKFLAWFYAGLRVQEGAHDSAEDARTAMILYHKHKELKAANKLQGSLKELYKTGRSCGWVVPES